MKLIHGGLCGLALLMVTACGNSSPVTTSPPVSTSTAGSAPATSQSAAGSVAHADATVDVDGVLFVGADKAKVGDTITISVTNSTSGSIEATLLDPAGNTASHVSVASQATADISAVATTPGTWKITFEGTAIGTGLDAVITVS